MKNCSWCVAAKQLAEQYQLEHEVINLGPENPEAITELRKLVPDLRTVPQIFWHGRYIGGYEEFAKEIEHTIGGYGEGQC
jgi:glutaredoxin